MKAVFSVEFINAESYKQLLGMTRTFNGISDGLGDYLIGGVPPNLKPWVAEITGRDPKFKLARHFLKPQWDYSGSNSTGSRGIELRYILESGKLYQASYKISRKRNTRKFLRISDAGEVIYLSDSEAERWLSAH